MRRGIVGCHSGAERTVPDAPKLTQKSKDVCSEPEVLEPRLDLSISAYPTESQMDTMFNAYVSGGKAAMVEVLKAARQKREQDRAEDARLLETKGEGGK